MKTIKTTLPTESFDIKTFDAYFGGRSFAVLDIETTGLSAHNDSVILTGFLTYRNGELEFTQFFAQLPSEEHQVISATIDLLNTVDFIVTYNGKFFDIPFIAKRAAKNDLVFPDIYDLDLFLVFKHYSDIAKVLKSMTQKGLETYAGIDNRRTDTLNGMQSVKLYNQYVNTHSADMERQILLHNSDDVLQLYRLLPLIRQADIHRALQRHGFPVDGGRVKTITYKHQELILEGLCDDPLDYIKFPTTEEPYSLTMSKDGSFTLVIPCEKHGDSIYFDAAHLLDEHMISLDKYPGFASGFLIVKEDDMMNSAEINFFAMEFLPLLFELIHS